MLNVISDLALHLFSEAFADVLESLSQEEENSNILSLAELEQIQTSYVFGRQLSQSIPELFNDFGLDIEDFLSNNHVHSISASINYEWNGKYTLAKFYEEEKSAAVALVLNLVGYSHVEFDSHELNRILRRKGVELPKYKFQADHEKSWLALRLFGAAFRKIKGSNILVNNENGATN